MRLYIYHSILKSNLIVQNIGFCVRHPDLPRESLWNNKKAALLGLPNNIVNNRVISVYEFATDMTEEPLGDQLRRMRTIVSMIASLNATVAGPVSIGLFQFRHIAIRDGKWVLIDLGSFDSGHVLCDEHFWEENKARYTRLSMREIKKVRPGKSCPSSGNCVNGLCQDPYKYYNRDRFCDFVWKQMLNSDIFNGETCRKMSTDQYLDYLESTYTKS